MTPKLILALQFSPHDIVEAESLLQFIVDMQLKQGDAREDVDFALAARRGCDPATVEAMAASARLAFKNVLVIQGKGFATGWPEGCNALWAETMMRLSLAAKNGKTDATAVLTFEPDCVPMRDDWIDLLNRTWAQTVEQGKLCAGHIDLLADGSPHINGNAMFDIHITRDYPELNGCAESQGWDCYHRELLMKLGRDTDAIHQLYGKGCPDPVSFASIRKKGKVPAFHHGIKQGKGVEMAREMVKAGTFAKKPSEAPFTFTPQSPRDYMKTAIFIRTYAKDAEWLGYLLRSLEKFASGFSEIIVAYPQEDRETFQGYLIPDSVVKFFPVIPISPDGYIDQQISKVNADGYTDADFILFVDSDCFATRPFSPQDFFRSGKPMMIHRAWEGIGDAESWAAPTELALGFKPERETMCRMPIIHSREALRGLRSLMEHNTGADASHTIASYGKFSEFNAIGNFVLRYMPDAYSLVSREDEAAFPHCMTQRWSHGGLTEEIRAEMEEILKNAPSAVIEPDPAQPDAQHHDNDDHSPMPNRFYQALCNKCGWSGCSCLCGIDTGGDDSDVYCPICASASVDSISNHAPPLVRSEDALICAASSGPVVLSAIASVAAAQEEEPVLENRSANLLDAPEKPKKKRK